MTPNAPSERLTDRAIRSAPAGLFMLGLLNASLALIASNVHATLGWSSSALLAVMLLGRDRQVVPS